MPFINVKTNVKVEQEVQKQLHIELDKAVALIPAVDTGWTMSNIEDDCNLWFEGSDAPAAFVDVSVYGNILDENCNLVTAKVTEILNEQFNVPKSRVYVRFISAPYWGCNGENY